MEAGVPAEIRAEPGAADIASRLTVVPRRNYGIWIGTALALVLAAVIFRAFASNPAFAWDTATCFTPRSCAVSAPR